MDDLPGHEAAGVADAIRRAGAAVVYRPPGGPDLNPIEQVFARAESGARGRKPRAVAAAEGVCGNAVDWLPADERRSYTRHARYGPQGSH